MYNEELENLISAALADGVLTEKEKQILFKRAQSMGIDLDEFEMVLDAKLVELAKAEKAKAEASAPKSNKLGDVKKCPACGAMVQSYHGVCPECGYAFEGIDANSAVKELSGMLQNASSEAKMEGIIDNFPIPMEKASLLAFITWLRPQSLDVNNPLAKSYLKKYAECVNKIRVSFANDKELQLFVSQYEEDSKKIKKQRAAKQGINILKKPIIWIILAVLIITSVILGITNSTSRNSQKCRAAIEKALRKGDVEKAIELYVNYDAGHRALDGCDAAIMDACVEREDFRSAKMILSFSGGQIGSWSDHGEAMALKLYESSIAHDNYEIAWELVQEARYKEDYYGNYIRDVVIQMCKNGDKEGAKEFVKEHVSLIESRPDKYFQNEMDAATKKKERPYFEYLSGIIENY